MKNGFLQMIQQLLVIIALTASLASSMPGYSLSIRESAKEPFFNALQANIKHRGDLVDPWLLEALRPEAREAPLPDDAYFDQHDENSECNKLIREIIKERSTFCSQHPVRPCRRFFSRFLKKAQRYCDPNLTPIQNLSIISSKILPPPWTF